MGKNTKVACKNVFKNNDRESLCTAFTLKWINLINQMEKNKYYTAAADDTYYTDK